MKLKESAIFITLAIVTLLIPIISAETVIVGNYSIDYNISKPHENEIPNDITLKIKTFDGYVKVWPTSVPVGFENDIVYGIIEVDGDDGILRISPEGYFGMQTDKVSIFSTMPFYDTADFLRTLHIQPIESE